MALKKAKKVEEVAPEMTEELPIEEVVEVVEEVVEKPKKVKKVGKVNPKPVIVKVTVCKDENGDKGRVVEGVVSEDGSSVITLDGVTYAL